MADFDFSTLVTDRATADLELLRGLLSTPMEDWTEEQLAEFNLAASKGAYNYTDLNRVTAAMDYLNEVLTGLGYETGYQRIVVPHQDSGGRLPSGYTELQYIQSTGTQWIDTGITPTQDYTLYTKVAFLGSSGTNVLGTRNSSNDTTNRFGIISFGSSALFGAFYGTNSVTGKAVDQTPHEFSIGPDGFTMDEETVSVQQTNFSCSYPIILFGFNNGANGIVGAEEKVYSCKIYSDGQLVREFIPCTNPDGIIGLYDLINAQFYGNAGSGDFLKGPELVTLPIGYKQLEYIQSTGAQYINTSIIPDADTVVIVDFQTTEKKSSNNDVFGVVGQFSFRQYAESDFFRTVSGSTVDFSTDVDILARHEVYKSMLTTTIDGEYTVTTTSATCSYPLFLFAYNGGTYVGNYGYQRIFSCSVFDGDKLIREFIPAKNESGEIGLYDTENSQFYGNAGAGVFIAGPEVTQPGPEPTLDPYTWYETDIPTASQMAQYLENVSALRGVLTMPETIPIVPRDMVGLTQVEANTIESILELIQSYLSALQQIFLRCGATTCGGPGFYFIN